MNDHTVRGLEAASMVLRKKSRRSKAKTILRLPDLEQSKNPLGIQRLTAGNSPRTSPLGRTRGINLAFSVFSVFCLRAASYTSFPGVFLDGLFEFLFRFSNPFAVALDQCKFQFHFRSSHTDSFA